MSELMYKELIEVLERVEEKERNGKRGNRPETGRGHLTISVSSPKRSKNDSPISLRENEKEVT